MKFGISGSLPVSHSEEHSGKQGRVEAQILLSLQSALESDPVTRLFTKYVNMQRRMSVKDFLWGWGDDNVQYISEYRKLQFISPGLIQLSKGF